MKMNKIITFLVSLTIISISTLNASESPPYKFNGGRFGDNISTEYQSDDENVEEIKQDRWRIKPVPLAPFFMTYLEDVSHPSTEELIKNKQYGPALAKKLDIQYLWDGYKYDAKGVYRRDGGGVFIHSVPRHLCEKGVSREDAEKKHAELEPPSFVGRDGTRHYAIMH